MGRLHAILALAEKMSGGVFDKKISPQIEKYASWIKGCRIVTAAGSLFILAEGSPVFDYSMVTSRNPSAAAGTSAFLERCG